MKGRAIEWSDAELVVIKLLQRLPRKDLHRAFVEWTGRREVSVDHIRALCKRRGWHTGRTGCFGKGHVPANKGKKMPYNRNSARTQFKKGNLPHNTKYVGHERISKDGYVEISINETNPHTGYERRYVMKHKWLWEQANGPIEEGMRLKCLDGNKLNTDPSNWEAVPMGLAPRLNGRFGRGYDKAPSELKPTILAAAKLEHAAREIGKKRK